MCRTDEYFRKSPPNKLRDKFTTPATSKMEFFMKLVNAVSGLGITQKQ